MIITRKQKPSINVIFVVEMYCQTNLEQIVHVTIEKSYHACFQKYTALSAMWNKIITFYIEIRFPRNIGGILHKGLSKNWWNVCFITLQKLIMFSQLFL